MQDEVERLRTCRYLRGRQMVERLRTLGYPISFERVQDIASGGNIVRPHVAQALVEAGGGGTQGDAFTPALLPGGGRGHVPNPAPRPLHPTGLTGTARGRLAMEHPCTWST